MIAKQVAAAAAVKEVKNNMTVGLGTGSTAAFAIKEIGIRVKEGLFIKAVASSVQSEQLAKREGIEIIQFSNVGVIDIYIDGADEVDADLNLIKGGGGALLREKILAYNSRQFIVIVDDSKLVNHLGKFPLPVEITPFAFELTLRNLEKLGCQATIRKKGEKNYITDNGNLIADCDFGKIIDTAKLEKSIKNIPGVMECGLFQASLVNKLFVGYEDGKLVTIDRKT